MWTSWKEMIFVLNFSCITWQADTIYMASLPHWRGWSQIAETYQKLLLWGNSFVGTLYYVLTCLECFLIQCKMYLYSYGNELWNHQCVQGFPFVRLLCHVINNFRYIISSNNQVVYTGYIFWSNGKLRKKIFLVVIKHFQYTFRIKAAILTRLDWYRTVFNQSFNRTCAGMLLKPN